MQILMVWRYPHVHYRNNRNSRTCQIQLSVNPDDSNNLCMNTNGLIDLNISGGCPYPECLDASSSFGYSCSDAVNNLDVTSLFLETLLVRTALKVVIYAQKLQMMVTFL